MGARSESEVQVQDLILPHAPEQGVQLPCALLFLYKKRACGFLHLPPIKIEKRGVNVAGKQVSRELDSDTWQPQSVLCLLI